MICRYETLKESSISVGRIYVNELYIDLVHIAFCQQSDLESILSSILCSWEKYL